MKEVYVDLIRLFELRFFSLDIILQTFSIQKQPEKTDLEDDDVVVEAAATETFDRPLADLLVLLKKLGSVNSENGRQVAPFIAREEQLAMARL